MYAMMRHLQSVILMLLVGHQSASDLQKNPAIAICKIFPWKTSGDDIFDHGDFLVSV